MIKDMLKPETIFLNVEVPDGKKKNALKILSEKCAAYSGMKGKMLLKAFEQREKIETTGFGEGVAIPHAKIDGLNNPFIAIMRFQEPIDWDAIDGQPVTTVIALVMPTTDKDNTHLKVISSFSRKLADADFVKGIKTKESADKLYQFVIEETEDHKK